MNRKLNTVETGIRMSVAFLVLLGLSILMGLAMGDGIVAVSIVGMFWFLFLCALCGLSYDLGKLKQEEEK